MGGTPMGHRTMIKHTASKHTADSCKWAIVISLVIAASFQTGCRNKDMDALNSMERDKFIVKTERAEMRSLEEQLILVGSIKAMDEAVIYPRVYGKVLKNLLKEGDPVKRGQPLALIERDEVGIVYEPAPVPSTINGVVGRMMQDVGASVAPMVPIALVVNQSQVRIKVDIPERYIGQISTGQLALAKVDAFPGVLFRGNVYKISPVIDPYTRSAPVEILVENPKNLLKSGMFAQVNIAVEGSPNATSVSAACILQDEKGRDYVFLAANGKALKRPVTIGIKTMDYVQILSDITAGDEIVNSGLYGLKDGSKIEIIK